MDTHYGITVRVIAGLDELGGNARYFTEGIKQDIHNAANDTMESVIDYAIESAKRIIIITARHHIDKFLSTQPRVF